jgi:hypothetical protein
MRFDAARQVDSIRLFAPMAVVAFQMLGTLNTEQRYDFGRVAEFGGDAEIAAAQADTILAGNPRHLLGLILAAGAADMQGDTATRRAIQRRLLAAAPTERSRALPEYARHASDIALALDFARPK